MAAIKMMLHDSESRTECGDMVGQIVIGAFSERFHVSARLWTASDYSNQWEMALHRVQSGMPTSVAVASLDALDDDGGLAFLWVFYRSGGMVFVQNSMKIFDSTDCSMLSPDRVPWHWAGEREVLTEDGDPISEWSVPVHGLDVEVEKLPSTAQQEKARWDEAE